MSFLDRLIKLWQGSERKKARKVLGDGELKFGNYGFGFAGIAAKLKGLSKRRWSEHLNSKTHMANGKRITKRWRA